MSDLSDILKSFSKKNIVVVGDVMLDKTIRGEVSRISPEAPVPVLNVKAENYGPGGVANTAANVASLKGNTCLFGFAGNDENKRILLQLLNKEGIETFFDENTRTTTKVRLNARNQQILRFDYEDSSTKKFSSEIIEVMTEKIKNSDILLVSDYAKGTITPTLMDFLRSLNIKIIVDPKPKNFSLYHDLYLITPNEKEALEMSGKENIRDAGRFLKETLRCDNVLITRGEKGMFLFSDKELEIPTYAREVYDVSGAGDTAIAALSLSLASGASVEEAAIIANHAAGIAVSKAGAYQVKLNELEKKIFGEEEKLKTFDELSRVIFDLKKKGKRIVWTNGCFDILHKGHRTYLSEASQQGDYLIVGLNSDSSVRNLKGPDRPVNHEGERAEALSIYPWVDHIMIFSEQDPINYLKKFKPDVYVKGGDYTIDNINQEERKVIESYGGKILIIDTGQDHSTTKLIERIRNPKNE